MKTALNYKIVPLILTLFLSAGIASCSAQETAKSPDDSVADKTLSFYKDEEGKKVHYKAGFDRENRLTYLELDGREIPEEKYDEYSELVYDEAGEISPRSKRMVYRFDTKIDSIEIPRIPDLPEFPKGKHFIFRGWDDSTLADQMKEHYFLFKDRDMRLADSLRKKAYIFRHWEDSSFQDGMKRMNEELAKLKDIKVKFRFDDEKFRKEMEILRREISELNMNEELKEINEDIKKMTEELRDTKIDIDEIEIEVPELEIEIQKLDRKKMGLDKELSGLRTELKKLEGFMDDIRKELYLDGIIDSEEQDFSLKIGSGRISIDGRDIPSDKLGRYKEIYRKHFGKELRDSERLEIN